MTIRFFKDLTNIEELKQMYKKLCFEHHPDRGGNEENFKSMQAEFEHIKKNGMFFSKSNYADSAEAFEDLEIFKTILDKIIHLIDLEIEICGRWIWLSGNTYEHKEEIKSAGFKFASKKKMWFWHREEDSCRSRKNTAIEEIRSKYGSQRVASSYRMAVGQ